MSYSAVDPSPTLGTALQHISTRIAFSDDAGRSWKDAGLAINASQEFRLPPPRDEITAVWEHEVSSLAHDPAASPQERWKLLWHRFLRVHDPTQPRSVPLWQHGWIGLRTAPSPEGPWSPERKLFVGRLYDPSNDSDALGPPEHRLHEAFPDRLGGCLAFTEPGLLATAAGLYVALKCPQGSSGGKIVLLRCARDFSTCDYRGAFLDDGEARHFQSRFDGFSAPDLVAVAEKTYLIATPTEGPASRYRGCLVFEVEALDEAQLRREDGLPVVVASVSGRPGSFNGACGYAAAARGSGVLYSEFFPDERPQFRIFASEVNL
jgi:hypothetical protein